MSPQQVALSGQQKATSYVGHEVSSGEHARAFWGRERMNNKQLWEEEKKIKKHVALGTWIAHTQQKKQEKHDGALGEIAHYINESALGMIDIRCGASNETKRSHKTAPEQAKPKRMWTPSPLQWCLVRRPNTWRAPLFLQRSLAPLRPSHKSWELCGGSPREHTMGELFRSEEMVCVQLFIQYEAAHATVDELGKMGSIQFTNVRVISI